jgi:hypothetical protein
MTLLITPAEVNSIAFSESGFYGPFIKDSLIETAQLSWLRPAIGEELYNLLLTEKEAGSYSESSQAILDMFIRPALAWYAAWLTLPFAANKINSLGVMDTFFDYKKFDGTDTGETARQAYLSLANTYRTALVDYLETNKALYPLYRTQNKVVTLLGGLLIDRQNKML